MMSPMTSLSPISLDIVLHPWYIHTYSAHTSKRFIVNVKNVVISFKHQHRRLNLTLRCDLNDGITSVKHTVSGINCNDLLGYDMEMNLSKIFQNGRHFEARKLSWKLSIIPI